MIKFGEKAPFSCIINAHYTNDLVAGYRTPNVDLSNVQLEVFTINDGFVSYFGTGTATPQLGFEPTSVREAMNEEPVTVAGGHMKGGGFGQFFSKVRDVMGHIGGPLRAVASLIPNPMIQTIANGAIGALGGKLKHGKRHRHGGSTRLMA